ncbi:MAG: hypothetical protein ACYC77_08635 [Coriobacteriia bacterium]
MSAPKTNGLASFAAAFGTISVAAVLTRACPGGCTSCTTCAITLVPMGTAAGAVGLAFAGSAWAKRREKTGSGATDGPHGPEV